MQTKSANLKRFRSCFTLEISGSFTLAEFKWSCCTSARVAVKIRPKSPSSKAQISSAQTQPVWAGGKSFQISQLIAVSERAWRGSPNLGRSLAVSGLQRQRTAQSRRRSCIQEITRGRSASVAPCGRETMRHRLLHEPLGLYCRLFFKWQTICSNSAAERSIHSVFNRQVTDGDVIGKAVSNGPVKASHRAIIRGLLQGLAPLTLGNTSREPLTPCDLSVRAQTFFSILSFRFNYGNVFINFSSQSRSGQKKKKNVPEIYFIVCLEKKKGWCDVFNIWDSPKHMRERKTRNRIKCGALKSNLCNANIQFPAL